MNRPFTPDDDGKRFSCDGRVGKLEFPLEDPGSAGHFEGILWYDYPTDGAGWRYVSPADVEPEGTPACVYSSAAGGFVTDFGAPVVLTPVLKADAPLTIPRYGVWKRVGNRLEVIFTTDDYDEAKRACDAPRPI